MDTQTASDWLTEAPWRDRAVTIVCHREGWPLRQERTLDGKRDILREAPPGLLALWTGKWYTSARIITEENRRAILEALA